MKLSFRAFSFGFIAVMALYGTSTFGQEAPRIRLSDQPAVTDSPKIQLPASVQSTGSEGSEGSEGIVNPAFPVLPDFGSSTEPTSPQIPNLAPLQSLLKLQGFELVKKELVYQETEAVVQPASEPVLGAPRLPSNIAGPQTASYLPLLAVEDPAAGEESEEPSIQCKNSNQIEDVQQRMKRYLGQLTSQAELFGNLQVTPSEAPTFMGVDQRMSTEGVIDPWNGDVYCWTTPGFYHNPLYFEQVNLERYGQGTYPALQPLVSGSQFLSTIAILPYHIGNQPWDERAYTLGHYRPGNRNPHRFHYQRFTWKGVVYQACATTGLVFVVP